MHQVLKESTCKLTKVISQYNSPLNLQKEHINIRFNWFFVISICRVEYKAQVSCAEFLIWYTFAPSDMHKRWSVCSSFLNLFLVKCTLLLKHLARLLFELSLRSVFYNYNFLRFLIYYVVKGFDASTAVDAFAGSFRSG